jgi:HSP20 family molecular chaperone IbpA
MNSDSLNPSETTQRRALKDGHSAAQPHRRTPRPTPLLALGLALAAGGAIALGALHAAAAGDPTQPAGFAEKMKQWQDKMSEKFRETWEGWRGPKAGQSIGAASVDLREQPDSYTVRLNLPNRNLDEVEIRLNGNALEIVAPAENKASRYEQTLTLANAADDAKLVIDRRQKENLIVVTVPKGREIAAAKPAPFLPDPALAPLGDWDREIFDRMEKMRRDMDQIFSDSFQEFQKTPDLNGFFDRSRFGSSLDLQEEGPNYVVRAYLPDRNTAKVNVAVTGQVLKIEAQDEEEKKQDKENFVSRKERYSQVITLPGPVQADKIKIDKKQGMVVITLPKA